MAAKQVEKANASLIATNKSPNVALIKQALLHRLNNKRAATSATKTRGMVSGGGRKPFKQKGTGRARAGSSRSPIWIGGGKAFGPHKDRNYKSRLPKKMKRAAFLQMLSLVQDSIISVPTLSLSDIKTKTAVALLKKHDLEKDKVLLVTQVVQPELIIATNNLPKVQTTVASQMSIEMLASGQKIVMESAVFDNFFPPLTKTAAVKKVTTKKAVQET